MTDKTSRKSPREHLPEDVREHLHAAREEMHKSVEGILPPEFVAHRRAARKEMLLAFRGMLDHAIQRIDEHTANKA
ncbi:MAG: hypothetical protein NT121_01125 [Chloroflexi bacterium]|nr:hypothetical protein [Chloroflexota bacterium]